MGYETHFFFMQSELKDYIEEYLGKTDYYLIDYYVLGKKNREVLEIFLDRRETATIDDYAVISRELWKWIEESSFADSISKIVVSSPGIDEPFKYVWQLNKHVGRSLNVKLINGEEKEGILKEVVEDDEPKIVLEAIGNKNKKDKLMESEIIFFGDIKDSRVIVSFKKVKKN